LDAYLSLGGKAASETIKKVMLKKSLLPSRKRQNLAGIAKDILRRYESSII
jgi:hypothetical protein